MEWVNAETLSSRGFPSGSSVPPLANSRGLRRSGEELAAIGKILADFLSADEPTTASDFLPGCDDRTFPNASQTYDNTTNYVPTCLKERNTPLPTFICHPSNQNFDLGIRAKSLWASIPANERSCTWESVDTFSSLEVLLPQSFRAVRYMLLGEKSHFAESISKILPSSPVGGKSRAKFGVTADNRFIVKFLRKQELGFLRKNAEGLIWYWRRTAYDGLASTLVPILAAFVLRSVEGRPTDDALMIMPNLNMQGYRHAFDLKGMVRSRSIPSPVTEDYHHPPTEIGTAKAPPGVSGEDWYLSVFWDSDFENWLQHRPLGLLSSTYNYLEAALSNDTAFLAHLHVVDYSLLLLVKEDDEEVDGFSMTGGSIDFLRTFTWDKKIESVVKSVNSNILQLGSRLAMTAVGRNERIGLLESPKLQGAPTVIRPELYGLRFKTNILPFFTRI